VSYIILIFFPLLLLSLLQKIGKSM